MKVMVVCTTGGYGRRQFGGAERLLADLLPAMARAGVEVLAYTPDDEVAGALRAAGVPWQELAARRRVDPGYARAIARVVDTHAPDVVCAHLLSAAMHCRAALAVRHRRTPLVVTLHNSLWQYRDTAPNRREKTRVRVNIAVDLAMRRVRPHTSVAVSEWEADQLRTLGRVRNLQIIRNSLPAGWPAADRARVPDPSRPVQVGFLGRLAQEKGADLLGDLARALPEMRLQIAGTGTVRVPRLSNVELLGHVKAEKLLPELDCLVVPSRVESFGRSALEALSLGVPVVHSGAGGLAEVTRHAAGVLSFPAELAVEPIAAAVRAATAPVSQPGARQAVAQWYQQEFAFSTAVERWIGLCRSVVDEHR
jgi:glycosyltransferase involved in cell wall biosynthesis